MNEFRKQAIGMFCGILVFSSLFIGLLALYRNDLIEKDQANVLLNDISLKTYELNSVSISNRLAISDEVGKIITSDGEMEGVQNVFDFEITSNYDEEVYYEIYVTKEDFSSEIEPEYVKLYLVDLESGEFLNSINDSIPTYYDLRVATSDPMGRRLYYGTIGAKTTKKFRLRMWLADDYPVTSDISQFSVKVHTKVN